MSYTVLDVRTPQDQDRWLHPVIDEESMGVELEEADGDVEHFPVQGIILKQLVTLDNINDLMKPLRHTDIDLLVTDSRVAVACEDWARGDFYVGFGLGASLAYVENKLSERKAKREAAGTVLTGHVRYDWLRAVGYRPHARAVHRGGLRLFTSEQSEEGDNAHYFFLDLEFPKHVDAPKVAQSIVHRAARHWLDRTDVEIEPVARAKFEELAEAPLPPHANKSGNQFTSVTLPMYKYAHPEDALPPETMKNL